MKHYARSTFALAFFMLGTQSVTASSFTGNFSMDDDVKLFNFSLATASTATLHTLSFAGGINADGALIADGGFTPILSLFDGAGNFLTRSADPSGCNSSNPANPDPVTGNCWDASISALLAIGNYTLALTEYDNFANQPTLSDGFFQDGQGNFTGLEFIGQPGSFIAPNGVQRDNHWAVDLNFVDIPLAAPEPGSLPLAIIGLTALYSFTRRRTVF